MSASLSSCCLRGFQWDGNPAGHITKIGSNDTYITGASSKVAILFIADLFGWTFPNCRLLADHLASSPRALREKELFEHVRILRAQFERVGAVGYCWGGWGAFRLGAKEHQPPLVDAVAAGHPSLLTNKDVDEAGVPIQILAPERDVMFSAELKTRCFETFLHHGLPFDFQFYPGVSHGCMVRGDPDKPGDREAMTRGKNDVVHWFQQHLFPKVDDAI